MSEATAIAQSEAPRTRESLAADLRRLGVEAEMILLVHSSLSALGWVCGGPVAVVQALMDVLTPAGTLVMPTHSGDYSDPAEWSNPPVPADWHPIIRDTMPPFDPRVTPTRGMGAIVELFRTVPGVRRSSHPSVSFAAWGRHAEQVVEGHALAYSLGEASPLGRLYALDAYVLLLGVGYNRNTSFHLAEYRVAGSKETTLGAPLLIDGERRWVTYPDIEVDSGPFPTIGAVMEEMLPVNCGTVGSAQARLFSLPAAVDFAQKWLEDDRRIGRNLS